MRISDWSSDVCSSDLRAPPAVSFSRSTARANRIGTSELMRAVAARSESERTRRSFIPRSPFGQTKGSSRRRTVRSRPAPRRGGREGREGAIEGVMGLRGAGGHERGRVRKDRKTDVEGQGG